jgi:hypothetical protein
MYNRSGGLVKYAVLVYEGNIDLEKVKKENIEIMKSELPIPVNGLTGTGYSINIHERIKLFDYLREKKMGEIDIDELAESTVDYMLPNASKQEKEKAKENYFNIIKTKKMEAYIISLPATPEHSDPNIIITSNKSVFTVLNYLNIKQNMTFNLFSQIKINIDDFLLWVCWKAKKSKPFRGILIRNIVKDETEDSAYAARTQTEKGGNGVLSSSDFQYRIGRGFPLRSLVFSIIEQDIGAKLEIGIFMEDLDGPLMTVSNFNAYKDLRDKLTTTNNYDVSLDIHKKSLAIDAIYKLVDEYGNDSKTWQSEKQSFILEQQEEAEKTRQR